MQSASFDRKSLVPALAGAGICLFLQRTGFLSLFFLVPLGFLAFRYNYRVAWLALLFAVLGNAFITVSAAAALPFPQILWSLLFFSVMASLFTWIAAPPPFSGQVSWGTRFIIGSCLGAAFLSGIFFWALTSPLFLEQITVWINSALSLYRSAGSDVVQNAMLDSLNAEMLLEGMKAVMIRGGGLLSCAFLFFISHQVSAGLASMPVREKESPKPGSIIAFHVSPALIWVFSVSLLLLLLTWITELWIPEIILWNILILCAILYLIQGCGILQFFFAKPMHPFSRFLLHAAIIVLILSPGINAFFLAGLVLLGIAENWVPFRAPKQNGPPSTPKAGDDGN